MSDSSSKSVRASAIVRVALPGAATIVGLISFIFGVFSWRADALLRLQLLIGGGAAFATGFLALFWFIRARFSDDPAVRALGAIRADMAIGGVIAVLGLFGVGSETKNLAADFSPAQSVEGHVRQVADRTSGRSLGHHLQLTFDGRPAPVRWQCAFDCGPFEALLGLNGRSDDAAQALLIGDRLIGLSVASREILDAGVERGRLKASDGSMWAIFAAMAIGAGAYIPWRRRRGLRELSFDPRPRDYDRLVRDRFEPRRKPE